MYQAAERCLGQKRRNLEARIRQCLAHLEDGNPKLESVLQLYVVRSLIEDVNRTNVFPFTRSILFKIGMSVLFPIALMMVESRMIF